MDLNFEVRGVACSASHETWGLGCRGCFWESSKRRERCAISSLPSVDLSMLSRQPGRRNRHVFFTWGWCRPSQAFGRDIYELSLFFEKSVKHLFTTRSPNDPRHFLPHSIQYVKEYLIFLIWSSPMSNQVGMSGGKIKVAIFSPFVSIIRIFQTETWWNSENILRSITASKYYWDSPFRPRFDSNSSGISSSTSQIITHF